MNASPAANPHSAQGGGANTPTDESARRPTLEEVRESKLRLEAAIRDAHDRFHAETGLTVQSIRMQFDENRDGRRNVVGVSVEVRL
jgi:hypothetical protein